MKRKGKTLLFEAYYIYDLDIMRRRKPEKTVSQQKIYTENSFCSV